MIKKDSLESIKSLYGINPKNILTVSQISTYIKDKLTLDPALNQVYILGELTNLSKPNSGHIYFDIKDERNILSCAFFKNNIKDVPFEIENGLKVLILGSIKTYERKSLYQLNVSLILPVGEGAFYLKFKQLKEKLAKEGLFNKKYKKELPLIPKCIGLITSKTGLAINDVTRVIKYRFPNLTLKLITTSMQGIKAPGEIINAINTFQKPKDIDLILIVRGGGSIEDLICFNNEELARVIFKSKIPIITGIGHATDSTIADFVADKQATTPSTAAEIAVPNQRTLLKNIYALRQDLKKSYANYIKSKQKEKEELLNKIKHYREHLKKSYANYIKSKQKEKEELLNNIKHYREHLKKSYANYLKSKQKEKETKKYKELSKQKEQDAKKFKIALIIVAIIIVSLIMLYILLKIGFRK